MHLLLDGQRLSLSQLGPDFAILTHRVSLPPTNGEIELIVDGNVSRWAIRLEEGVHADSQRFRFKPLSSTI